MASTPDSPRPAPSGPIVLFDGVCNFCEGSVRFILPRDPGGAFRFAALQSDAGRALALRYGHDPDRLDTLILVDGDRMFTKSDAALRIASRLKLPWRLARIFLIVPRPVRDAVYDLIARNRYRLFGKKSECLVPEPGIRGRFLD